MYNYMKTTYIFIASIIILHAILCSCKKEHTPETSKVKGYIQLQLSQNGTMILGQGNLKSGNVNDFVVEMYDANAVLLKRYDKLSDVPASIELDKGEYYFAAYSSNSSKAAFDNPTYYGQSDHITLVGGDQKSVEVKCYISNVMVTVDYTDSVKSKFSDYWVNVYNQTDTLHFIKGDTREGYFNAGDLGVEAHLFYKKVDGTTNEKILHGSIPSAKAMKHYKLVIDASIVKGSSSISVTAIDSMSTEVITITDASTPNTTKTIADLVAGNLLITEVMADPNAIADAQGEWFEIYNNATFAVNINGLMVKTNTKTMTIILDHTMQPGDYVFLAGSLSAAAGALYYYGTALTLVNSSGSLQLLSNATTVIAEMTYSTAPTGASLSLDPSKMTYLLAKDPSSWCTATQTYSTGDKGTPGLINPACN
jgi:hypothetical protein